ncbi:uncharacterized protein LOC111029439 [Myzus persicae]|uniref:uncharacterized protein LOC111029439 n=1 Tax=Myzus persicae TaxID=13164 RepID=UPI000B9302B3|nr:uncharacterized protein LOC111029439 [Myzus persicae]
MIIIKVFLLIGTFSLSQSKNRFMPNLPFGEYRVVFEKMYPCEPNGNHPFQFNIYFDKKTFNETEVKGNVTVMRPFDDNFTFDLNWSSWGSTGGWIPNSNIYITKKACSTLKNLNGNLWFLAIKALNIKSPNCPIPVGTYVSSGLDLKILENHNFPKIYFYGKYKMIFKVKNEENKIYGCECLEIQLIRPWETPI